MKKNNGGLYLSLTFIIFFVLAFVAIKVEEKWFKKPSHDEVACKDLGITKKELYNDYVSWADVVSEKFFVKDPKTGKIKTYPLKKEKHEHYHQ